MSVRINVGEQYTAFRFRSGTSERGPWEVITVKEEGRAKQEVTLFPSNVPSGVMEGGDLIVKSISGVTRKKKKDSMGAWTQVDVCIYCEVEPVAPVKLEEDDDLTDLPFEWGKGDIDDSPDDLSDLF